MTIAMPQEVEKILEILKSTGFQGYLAGGCVRDSVMGIRPEDWDLCTDAVPEKVMEIFSVYTVIPTGIKHGTVTLVGKDGRYEITTFRREGIYSDGRRPDSVQYTADIRRDLGRRDFTVNAMAYNRENGLADPYGGLRDIRLKRIRCVGEPYERLELEDRLRKLRAVRIASQLGFEIEPQTLACIRACPRLDGVSAERIRQELDKLLTHANSGYGVRLLEQTGLLGQILPELNAAMACGQDNPHHSYTVGEHCIRTLESCPADAPLSLRIAALLHDVGKPGCKTVDKNGVGHFYGHPAISARMAAEILERLRYDKVTAGKVRTLVLHHDDAMVAAERPVRRYLSKAGSENFRDLLVLKEADICAQNPAFLEQSRSKLEKVRKVAEKILCEGDCIRREDLKIDGSDLLKIGFQQGRGIGRALDELLKMVIDAPSLNTRERLLAAARGFPLEWKQ